MEYEGMSAEDRQEQIKEIEEEIACLSLMETHRFAAYCRIVDRLRAALAEAKKGMKENA